MPQDRHQLPEPAESLEWMKGIVYISKQLLKDELPADRTNNE
jgi:hypothetical protein